MAGQAIKNYVPMPPTGDVLKTSADISLAEKEPLVASRLPSHALPAKPRTSERVPRLSPGSLRTCATRTRVHQGTDVWGLVVVSAAQARIQADHLVARGHQQVHCVVPGWGSCEHRLRAGKMWLCVKTNGIVYFSEDWDVPWGYGILTHGHV